MSDLYTIPARKPARPDPWPDSPITLRFRDAIARRESLRDGYRAFNPNTGGGPGAFGRYQMLKGARQNAAMMDDAGAWTGKHGIYSAENFFDDPLAQEMAFAAYMRKNQEYLSYTSRGYGDVGQIATSGDGNFTITENGLLAAAHRAGAGDLREYLRHLADHGWMSDPATFPSGELGKRFAAMETRLRDFEQIPYSKPRPIPPRRPW